MILYGLTMATNPTNQVMLGTMPTRLPLRVWVQMKIMVITVNNFALDKSPFKCYIYTMNEQDLDQIQSFEEFILWSRPTPQPTDPEDDVNYEC